MILPSPPSLIDEELPPDAPPAYDDVPAIPQVTTSVTSEKSDPVLSPTPSSVFVASPSAADTLKSPTSSKFAESIWAWLPSPSRTRAAADVKATIIGLLRELIKRGESGPPARSMLVSCNDVCRAYSLPLSSILQERCIEGHSALYWAVMKRPKAVELRTDQPTDVLGAFLTFAAPLSPAAISDVRLACLQTADQPLFQQLRRLPTFAPLSGSDDILLGSSGARDEVYVEDNASEDAFAVRFRIPLFQQRLRASNHICLEFIARGRLWAFRFLIASVENSRFRPIVESGTWLVTLSLLEHSAPTTLTSRLVIQDASASAGTPTSSQPAQSPLRSARVPERKPPIELWLKTGTEEIAPDKFNNYVVASFKKYPLADRLQYDGSPYIGNDGTLDATFEARLGKGGPDCTIC
ncbi:hypothetical protein DAEQUDRAFT_664466 [Daedalea quercina L-15889]|uniref:Uncharacterized protein n=1 Tax=Daedalea quercina L-15889 TaxID=1314783 RepID=A0A165SQN8_9APHY|nr:hypothetical protein DAEQUDRAFT_664466 [Daedalea quercina L-15889]